MNNQEAKLILQAYRPDGLDASDPFFAEALEQARQDPELQKWFADENALNARLRARLETVVPIPSGLKSELLALRKTSRPAPWWFQSMKLAAAVVGLLCLGTVFLLLLQKPTQLASFQQTMARSSAQMQEHVAFESHDMAKIQQWLQSRSVNTHFDLPTLLQGGIPQGCRVIDWKGRKVTMICFFLNGKHMDLFVLDQADLPGLSESGAPLFAKTDGLMTATWANGQKVYLLTGESKELLQKVLQST
jgi:anti-sigma factor RsiW